MKYCRATNCYIKILNGKYCSEHNGLETTEIVDKFGEYLDRNISKHPLLNPESKHYQMIDGVEAITRMEQMYDTIDLMAWCKISAMEHRLRIANKDDPIKEIVKIQGFEAYYKYLEDKIVEC